MKKTCNHWCSYLLSAAIGAAMAWGVKPQQIKKYGNIYETWPCATPKFEKGAEVVVIEGAFKGLVGKLEETWSHANIKNDDIWFVQAESGIFIGYLESIQLKENQMRLLYPKQEAAK